MVIMFLWSGYESENEDGRVLQPESTVSLDG